MLKISQPNTLTTEIQKFENPFLKIPIQPYLDLIGIVPNEAQYALINLINNPSIRQVVACIARRVGKTYIANIILQLVALYPGTTCLIIAPDYALASISWDLQQYLLDLFDIELTQNNSKDRVIKLKNGSMIRIASVSRSKSAVGRSYDLIIFDEAALNDTGASVFNTELRPTLDKLESKCIFISTPRGDNWFRTFFERGTDPAYPTWASIHADYRVNPRASATDIAEARNEMSQAEFEQEYLANFVTFEGQIWSFDSRDIHDLTELRARIVAAPGRVEIIGGLDVGFRDQTAFVVIYVEEDVATGLNTYYIIDEYVSQERTTEAHANAISSLVDKYDIDYIFIDSAAAQTRYDFAAMYNIATMNAKKSVTDGIGCVGAIVDNHRLIVHDQCIESIYSLRNYKWKGNVKDGVYDIEREKPAHTRAIHGADAIRYALYTYEAGYGGGVI